jgi:ABC-type glutathione transport system ATPase component
MRRANDERNREQDRRQKRLQDLRQPREGCTGHGQQGQTKDQVLAQTGCVVGVNDLSLSIDSGEIFVIMGLSGSGKSTLVRHFNRLIDPTSGEILVDGENILTIRHGSAAQLPPAQDQHGVPELRPAAAQDRAGQRRLRPDRSRREQAQCAPSARCTGSPRWA